MSKATQSSAVSGQPPEVESRMNNRSVEVRGSPGGQMRVGGYAATFGNRSEPLPGPYGAAFIETVAKSFFNKSRSDGWPGVLARFNHRDDMILGATRSGSLRLNIDSTGLDYEVDLLESRSDIYQLVRRGDIGNSSFSFLAYQDDWQYDDGMPLRTLISGKLLDVAPVTMPAYCSTSVALRSLAAHMDAPESDVTDAALAGELRRFFVRSDRQPVYPPKPEPRNDTRPPRLAAKQRQLEVLAWRWGTPKTKYQEQLEAMRPKTIHKRILETLAMDPDWS